MLKEAVESLEIGLDDAELVEAQQLHDILGAKLSAAYGEFDSAGLWDISGARQ